MTIEQLNTDFAINDQVTFFAGKGGLPYIKINTNKACALISIYAGQVLSFKPGNEPEDFMFISDNAFYQKGKAIRGGIPICWPWFGIDIENSENPNHGFVRNSFWSVTSVDLLENEDVKIKLEFADSVDTRKIWPYSFNLCLDIIIGNSLTLELITRNTGHQTFSITEALHTYFNVGDATQIQILGLEHTEYLDKTEDFVKAYQPGVITITEETDRIYFDVKHAVTLVDPVLKRKINIVSSGNKNIVVWNPWDKSSAQITDLDNEDYKHFICIETANAASAKVEIRPGDKYKLMTNYCVIRD